MKRIVLFLSEIFPILTLGLISQSWFPPGKLILGTDTVLPLNLSHSIGQYFYLWSDHVFPGTADVNKLPLLMPVGFILKLWSLLQLSFSAAIYERVVVYLLFTGAGLSTYFLFKSLFPMGRWWGKMTSAILAMFNFYVLFIFTPMPITLLFSYCLFPAVFAVFIRFLKNPSVKSATAFALFWFVVLSPSYTTPPYVLIHGSIFGLYFIYFIMQRSTQRKARLLTLSFFSLLVWLCLSSFWIIPSLANLQYELTAYATPNQGSPESLLFLNSAQIFNAFRLTGYFGLFSDFRGSSFYPWYKVFQTPLFTILTFLVPIIAFSGLLLRRKSRDYVFLCLLALIFIFLVKGPYNPMGQLNTFLFSHFYLTTFFRTAYQRFTGFTATFFALMFAYTIDITLLRIGWDRIGKKLASISIFLILSVALPLTVAFPLLNGQLGEYGGVLPSSKVRIPQDYFEAADRFNQNPYDGNVLPLPYNGIGQGSFWWNQGKDGYDGIYPLTALTERGFVVSSMGTDLPRDTAVKLLAGDQESLNQLRLLDIGFLIIHKDSNWEKVNYHDLWVSSDPNTLESKINEIKGLSLIRTFGQLDIYELDGKFLPSKIYVPSRIVTSRELSQIRPDESIAFSDNSDLIKLSSGGNESGTLPIVNYVKLNPTKYSVNISNVTRSFLLVFSDSYSNGWNVYLEKSSKSTPLIANIWSSISKVQQPMHDVVNGYANGWIIDPEFICKGVDCSRGTNGSYEMKLQIEYVPQKWFTGGLTILIFSLLICLVILLSGIHKKSLKYFIPNPSTTFKDKAIQEASLTQTQFSSRRSLSSIGFLLLAGVFATSPNFPQHLRAYLLPLLILTFAYQLKLFPEKLGKVIVSKWKLVIISLLPILVALETIGYLPNDSFLQTIIYVLSVITVVFASGMGKIGAYFFALVALGATAWFVIQTQWPLAESAAGSAFILLIIPLIPELILKDKSL